MSDPKSGSHFVTPGGTFLLTALFTVMVTLIVIVLQIPINLCKTTVQKNVVKLSNIDHQKLF